MMCLMANAMSSGDDMYKSLFMTAAFLGVLTSAELAAALIIPAPPAGADVNALSRESAGANGKALDAEVAKFLRREYKIKSVIYYQLNGDIPWIAVSKNVQNQMLEKAVKKKVFAWNNPGIDLIDVYPQKEGAFAVAMYTKTAPDKDKLVGYYLLTKNRKAP
jgi:hypothetical protein